jgi:hypothetical protein
VHESAGARIGSTKPKVRRRPGHQLLPNPSNQSSNRNKYSRTKNSPRLVVPRTTRYGLVLLPSGRAILQQLDHFAALLGRILSHRASLSLLVSRHPRHDSETARGFAVLNPLCGKVRDQAAGRRDHGRGQGARLTVLILPSGIRPRRSISPATNLATRSPPLLSVHRSMVIVVVRPSSYSTMNVGSCRRVIAFASPAASLGQQFAAEYLRGCPR